MPLDILCDLVTKDLAKKRNTKNKDIRCGRCKVIQHTEDNCVIGVPVYGVLCESCNDLYKKHQNKIK